MAPAAETTRKLGPGVNPPGTVEHGGRVWEHVADFSRTNAARNRADSMEGERDVLGAVRGPFLIVKWNPPGAGIAGEPIQASVYEKRKRTR